MENFNTMKQSLENAKKTNFFFASLKLCIFAIILASIPLPLQSEFIEYVEFEEFEEFATIDIPAEVVMLEHPVEEEIEVIVTQFSRENLIAAQENREDLIALVHTFSEKDYDVIKTDDGYFFVHEDEKLQVCPELKQYIKKGCTAIDYGAGNGVWTVALADLVGCEGKVVAFESHPQLFKEMFWNVALNHIQNAQLFCDDKTLDALNLENVAVIRINADGREDTFLAGASETIKTHKPILIIKMLGGIPLEWADRFVRQEYDKQMDQIHRMGYTTRQIASGDYLALPKN